MNIKLMSFNIQHGRNHNLPDDVIDLPLMSHTVNEQNPHIIGFNEVRGKGESVRFPDEPRTLADEIGGEYYFGRAISVSNGGPYGNLLVSKLPFLSFETVMIPDCKQKKEGKFYETRSLIHASVLAGETEITVLSSHFGLNEDEQQNAVDTVLSIVGKCRTPVILMGDFNMTPDNPLVKRIASEMTDAHKYCGADGYTFSSDNPKIKIDYIFVRDAEILAANIVPVIASDHFPVTAVVKI